MCKTINWLRHRNSASRAGQATVGGTYSGHITGRKLQTFGCETSLQWEKEGIINHIKFTKTVCRECYDDYNTLFLVWDCVAPGVDSFPWSMVHSDTLAGLGWAGLAGRCAVLLSPAQHNVANCPYEHFLVRDHKIIPSANIHYDIKTDCCYLPSPSNACLLKGISSLII